MNILVVSQYFWPERFRINEFVLLLSEQGHEVTVLTGYPNYPGGHVFPEFKSNPQNYDSFKGVDVFRVPVSPRRKNNFSLAFNYLSFMFSGIIFGTFKLKNKKFDVIITFQTSPVTVAVVSGWFRVIKNCPHILWVLDVWPDTLMALGILKNKSLIALAEFLVQNIYKGADCILVQSKGAKQIVGRLAPKNVNVFYFPSWYDDNLGFSKGGSKNKKPNGEKRFKIIFAGNVGKAQGFDIVLEAIKIASKTSNICLQVYGTGSKIEWLKNEVGRCGLERVVTIHGEVTPDEIGNVLASADALLISLVDAPIFQHTVPAKVQSCLASGKPIIGMIAGDAAEILSESRAAVLSRPGDVQSLAANISTMSKKDEAVLFRMGAMGKTYAEENFSSHRMIEQLEKILKTVI